LEHARKPNKAPSLAGSMRAPDADQLRNGSPCGDSTLITCAPPSANSLVQ